MKKYSFPQSRGGNKANYNVKPVNLIDVISGYAHYAQIALDETHTEYEVGNGGKYSTFAVDMGEAYKMAISVLCDYYTATIAYKK